MKGYVGIIQMCSLLILKKLTHNHIVALKGCRTDMENTSGESNQPDNAVGSTRAERDGGYVKESKERKGKKGKGKIEKQNRITGILGMRKMRTRWGKGVQHR
jgi:hypothetical protein